MLLTVLLNPFQKAEMGVPGWLSLDLGVVSLGPMLNIELTKKKKRGSWDVLACIE